MYRFGLIGNPVHHSQSPQIHQKFLDMIQAHGTYELIEVNEEDLGEQIRAFRNGRLDGCNVTVPYKTEVIPFLDELDDLAVKLQSVNTIKRKGNRLIGYNTDGIGYLESLKQAYPNFYHELSQKRILILGAGGAARGIYYSLQMMNPKQIDVANRTLEKAEVLSDGYSNSQSLSLSDAERHLSRYDFVIQTTTTGMSPYEGDKIISLSNLKCPSIVSDIVYKPKWTKLLREANQIGADLLFGETMLWYQAALAFEIWTGHSIKPFTKMM
ncbi:shikimate dehydrogenase [Tenuibacillus multivorans]|uniref:Shikimate dehydrogenase (NADP(+)) n=1 Tax=Tenuibacillus multivorans TaxID=237069 RepID=A0A1G9ZG83_9BACI|nr:shikimate dehydrogenase [Tenuibacillus multivorans]GEL77519.1 shikimate dehydrogenase (NADP(+)) [Tenuibacillus multivorans]SDN20205.1 shikimate dehydrogenase [Tenuibacillus multivorans]